MSEKKRNTPNIIKTCEATILCDSGPLFAQVSLSIKIKIYYKEMKTYHYSGPSYMHSYKGNLILIPKAVAGVYIVQWSTRITVLKEL